MWFCLSCVLHWGEREAFDASCHARIPCKLLALESDVESVILQCFVCRDVVTVPFLLPCFPSETGEHVKTKSDTPPVSFSN